MQLRKGAATKWYRRLHRKDLFNPRLNIYLGVRYLSQQIAKCGDLTYAMGAYSSGKCRSNPYARRLIARWRGLSHFLPAPILASSE
jgi:soluble lytic murein transglycosylase-like protein